MTLTPEQRDELRAKHAATRPGSWDFQTWGEQNQNGDYGESILYDGDGETMVYGIPDAEGDLIVAMRNTLPALLDALDAADAEVEAKIQADTDSLAAEIHEAVEFQYDQCDHGTYRGGHMHGEPYQMCRINAERIMRRRAARRDEESTP